MFPEYTILDFFSGGNAVLASFLIVRKVDPNAPFPIETASEAANKRGKNTKSKKADKNKDKAGTANATANGATPSVTPAAGVETSKAAESNDQKATNSSTTEATAPADATDKAKNEGTDKEKLKDEKPKLKEYYQPVTIRIYSSNPRVLEPLTRVVKPPDEVRKYMEDVMDRAERAPEGFLAFRLPREEEVEEAEAKDIDKDKSGVGAIKAAARNRTKGYVTDDDSGVEILKDEEEEEEELKDFYDAPSGLVPLGVV